MWLLRKRAYKNSYWLQESHGKDGTMMALWCIFWAMYMGGSHWNPEEIQGPSPDVSWWSIIALCWLFHPHSVDFCIQIPSCVWLWMYCDVEHMWKSEDNLEYWSLPFILFEVGSIFCSTFVYSSLAGLWASDGSACLFSPSPCRSAGISDAYHLSHMSARYLYLTPHICMTDALPIESSFKPLQTPYSAKYLHLSSVLFL